jgi:hypothetical protein
MATPLLDMEGTWEEIAQHAADFSGKKLRVIVLPVESAKTTNGSEGPSLEQKLAVIAASIPNEELAKLPPDFTAQLDHYIYGTPKR